MNTPLLQLTVDCACVIHGDYYDWVYVERLYNMLQVNSSHHINLHVFTEEHRPVPDHMIKHTLTAWPGIAGPKRSWWYKMQLFNSDHFSGQLFYLDLDTVIVGNIDWIWELNTTQFHAIHDFRRLWKPSWTGINSSLMVWNTDQLHWIWKEFYTQDINLLVKSFHGDQDFLSKMLVGTPGFCYLDNSLIKSWRWQAHDGGLDMNTRQYRTPGAGTVIDPDTSFLVFHGCPKPHEISEPVVQQRWQIKKIV
jgi:hypothetical protein